LKVDKGEMSLRSEGPPPRPAAARHDINANLLAFIKA